MSLVLSRGGMGHGPNHGGNGDDPYMDELAEIEEKQQELDELGNEFVEKMEEIQNVKKMLDGMSDDIGSKSSILRKISMQEANIQKQYIQDVSEKNDELNEKMTEIQEKHEEEAQKNREIAEEMDQIRSDNVDLSEISEAAKEANEQEVQHSVIADEIKEKVSLRQQMVQEQIRRMRTDNLK